MIKRLFDILVSGLLIIVLLPLMVLIAIWIKMDSQGPVLYKGERVGKGGKTFRMYKFRTMRKDADKMGGSSCPDDDPRITKSGIFLRKYKLNELPQLINVLKGEMSIVGPRPQVKWAVDLYSEEEGKLILGVRPGITDYASIEFSNEGEILRGSRNPDKDYLEKIAPEKMRLEIEYVKNRSFWVDVKIILKTLKVILLR